MNKMNQVQDDEIDLFELFQTLWCCKLQISAFIVIAVLLGGSFLFFSTTLYQSKIIFTIDTIPPFYDNNKVTTDFQKKFYSMAVFKDWQQRNDNASIVFEDFSDTKFVNGFVFSKSKENQLAHIGEEEHTTIFVKSNQLLILNEFFKYAQYINKQMTAEYVYRAKEELDYFKSRTTNKSKSEVSTKISPLAVDRYIFLAERGSGVLNIKHPTLPVKTSPKPSIIIALSIILGGMIGVTYVLISNAIFKRKDMLTKA